VPVHGVIFDVLHRITFDLFVGSGVLDYSLARANSSLALTPSPFTSLTIMSSETLNSPRSIAPK
jgi:hypothetical protein